MMHDQPNNPEYCQGIYEAAKALIAYWDKAGPLFFQHEKAEHYVNNLKRALEGKP